MLLSTTFKKSGYIAVDKQGLPIGVDNDSGGYPYIPADVCNIHFFASDEEAKEYANRFNLEIRSAEISIKMSRV